MAAVAVNIVKNFRKPFHFNQSIINGIMTSSFRAAEAIEELKKNPHYEKYAQKIATLQARTDPDELAGRLEKTFDSKIPATTLKGEKRTFSKTAEAKPSATVPSFNRPKALHDIMRTELIMNHSLEEIKQIWEDYHKHKHVIVATIPTETYYRISLRSKQFPVFLFPLPRGDGYEYVVCQFSGNEVHFTPLISYQTHKENALECLTVVHFTELKEKGIILMRGEYNKDVLNSSEALCLTNQLQLYYSNPNEKRMKLLERFTLTPDDFQHIDLIAELESLSI